MSTKQHLQQAIALHKAGKLEEAVQYYEKALQIEPGHPDVLHNLGILYMQQDNDIKGIPLLAQALLAKPENGEYWLNYVKALYKKGDPHEARRVLEQGIKRGLSGKVIDDIQQLILDACEKVPDYSALRSLENSGEHAQLIQQTRELMSTFGQTPELKQMLGAAFLGQGRAEEALSIFDDICKAQPDNVGFWNHRAVALKRLERLDEANEAYKKALECEPEDHVVLSNLGGNLNDQERYEDALPYLEKAVSIAPNAIGARVNLTNTLSSLGRTREGRQIIEAVLEKAPELPEALRVYGSLLIHAGEPELAIDPLQKARAKLPHDMKLHLSLAYALAKDGQTEKARSLYVDACETYPDSPKPWLGLAEIQLDEGNFSAVESACAKALKCDPNSLEAWAKKAYVREMTQKDTDWLARARTLLQKKEIRPEKEMLLHYAMGKFFDDTGNYKEAFASYYLANEHKKQFCEPYDHANHEDLVGHLTSVYTSKVCSRRLPGASSSRRPVLIVGMPRSGTSLTEQIIASHPRACGAGELRFWRNQTSKYRNETLNARYTPDLLQSMRSDCLMELDRHCPGADRVVDKMPGNFLRLGVFHSVFPEGRIIHTMRNPLDTCLSIYFQNFSTTHVYASDLNDLAHYWGQYNRLMAHWRRVLPSDIFLELPYEAMVEDQEKWSRTLIDFISLEWDERCLEFYKTKRKVSTASNWQVRQKIYKTSKERWRNYETNVSPLLPLLDLYIPDTSTPRKNQPFNK